MPWQLQSESISAFPRYDRAPNPPIPIHTVHHIHQPNNPHPPPPLHNTQLVPPMYMPAPPVASQAFTFGMNATLHQADGNANAFDSAEQLSQTLKTLLRVSPKNE